MPSSQTATTCLGQANATLCLQDGTFLSGNNSDLCEGSQPFPGVAIYDPASGDVYVTNSGNNVRVISGTTGRRITNITVPVPPMDSPIVSLAYDSANDDIYVSQFGGANVSVISGASNTVECVVLN